MELPAKMNKKFYFISIIDKLRNQKIKKEIAQRKKCELCNEVDEIHFRVKSINHTKWIFCCKKCWHPVSKEDKNSYGGTRKS